MPVIRSLGLALLAAVTLIASQPARAQDDYPSRPIRLIVDGPPGGINDIWARRYAQRLSESMKQSVVVDNRPGASGTIAAEALAKSPGDGYTMFYGGMNPLIAYPGAGGPIRYDLQKDFVPVALGTIGYPILVAGAGFGVKTLPELIAKGKGRPASDALACGTGGQASVQHFACEMLVKATGMKLRPVPYKGGALAAMDAANGVIPMASGFSSELLPMTTPGKLVALGVFGPNRLPTFPQVPTMTEAGFPNIDLPSFSGFYVPAGTPARLVDRLNAELVRAMQQPQMKEWLDGAGGVWQPMTPAEFGEFYRREQAKWKRMSEETGVRVEL